MIGDLNSGDCIILLATFIVFSVAFAIVRNLFSRMWGRIPEKNNWKQSFKRRLGNNKNNNSKKNDDKADNAYDYQTLEDGPSQDPEKNVRNIETKPSLFNRFSNRKTTS